MDTKINSNELSQYFKEILTYNGDKWISTSPCIKLQLSETHVFQHGNHSNDLYQATYGNKECIEITLNKDLNRLLINVSNNKDQIIPEIHLNLSNHHGQLEILVLHEGAPFLKDSSKDCFSFKIHNKQSDLTLHHAVKNNAHFKKIWLDFHNECNLKLFQWHHHDDHQECYINVQNAKEQSLSNITLLANLSNEAKVNVFSDMRHLKGESKSVQVFKSILNDRSFALLTGKIFIDENCNKTEANFLSKHILLSKEAEILSRPQLEIHSDDVICGHGSSTGYLQAEEIFYLESRGIKKDLAKKLLLKAFLHSSDSSEESSTTYQYCKGLLHD